jgi:Reverse transcriptase (RNA-dependent DNA polymerase)
MRIIVSLARAFAWDIQSHDVTQAYIQADEMNRAVFLRPPAEFHLKGKLLLLVKPLYGLTNAGDIWHKALSQFIKNQLGMRELVSDAGVLFISHACCNLLRIILSYVDDLLITGCFEFLEKSRAIDRRFKSRPRKTNMFTQAGVDIRSEPD